MKGIKNFKGLRKLNGKVKIYKIFGFDTETYNKNKYLLCASIVGNDYKKVFFSRQSIIDEIRFNRIFRNSFLFATNLGFDFGAIFPDFNQNFKNFDIIERQGSIIFAKTYIDYENKNFNNKFKTIDNSKEFYPVTFCDSINHLRASVKSLGKIIKLEKLNPPDNLGEFINDDKELKKLVLYNLRDSEITFKFMQFIQDNYNKLGCNLKVTISSTALDLFRRKFLFIRWQQEKRNFILKQYKAYYGGRTEAFKRGLFKSENGYNIKVYDVNSLYPTVLEKFEYPIPDGSMKKKISFNDIENFEGIVNAELKIKDLNIPFVPYRDNKLLFPIGKIKGYYDFFTLRKALSYGYEIIKLNDGLVYEHKFKPFKHYINVLWKLRQELRKRNDSSELIPKILMNSFYGKLGFKFYEKELIVDVDFLENIKNIDTKTIIPFPDNKLFRVITKDNAKIPNYVFPIMPLYVTAYARHYLYKIFNKIDDDKIFYCDTDSIFTTKILDTGNGLGELKLEKIFDELIIVKPKFYGGLLLENKQNIIKVKGMHNKINNYHFLKDMILNDNFTVKSQYFRKLRGVLNGKGYMNELYVQDKTMLLEDDKRVWELNKFTSSPQNSMPINI